jgi:hypothetical protein
MTHSASATEDSWTVHSMIDNKKPSNISRLVAPNVAHSRPLELAPTAREAIVQQGNRGKLLKQQTILVESRGRMSTAAELRKVTRYQLTSVAVIRWLGEDEDLREASGVVRDISTCGVYVESTAPLPLSANVELEITPPNLQPYGSGPNLHFEGRVVRTERHSTRMGFAVAGFLYVSGPRDPHC